MIGSGWSTMVGLIQCPPQQKSRISKKLYDEFCRYYLFDAIKGLTFGQAFCKKFSISDNLLLYTIKNENAAKKYIKNSGYIEAKVH